MRINNNLMAMNAHRQLGITNAASGKTLEKLSSGMRINRAGDDAAGLAISEKMRGQIRGLNMASKNAQDGISFIQTAEGALTESHAILQRMRELAVQSANDTNIDVDRNEIQKEIDQLAQELTRIANDTEFNQQTLLNGGITDAKFHIGANEGQDITLAIKAMDAFTLGVGVDKVGIKATVADVADPDTANIATAELADEVGSKVVEGEEVTFEYDDTNKQLTVKIGPSDAGKAFDVDGNAKTFTTGNDAEYGGITITLAEGSTLSDITATDKINIEDDTIKAKAADIEGGEKAVADKGIDVSTQQSASTAITTIQSAIETVSAERSKLGAMQNRLEHTIKNLDTSAENLQASESRIRDIDMAKEMMEFTKNNILQQAATAMLAQANQAPQSVLQLLR